MGSKYTSVAISGYNASPPPDDGTSVPANLIGWNAGIKAKIGDPLVNQVAAINTAVLNALDFAGHTVAVNTVTAASDNGRVIECTTALTITLLDAALATTGYVVSIKNTGTGTVTVALQTATDTLQGTVNGTTTVPSGGFARFRVNTAANGYIPDSVSTKDVRDNVTTTGTAPNFVLTPSNPTLVYDTQNRYRVTFHAAGAGTDQLNISSLGNKALKSYNSSGAKVAFVPVSGMICDLQYDGTDLVVLNSIQTVATSTSLSYVDATGTSDAIVATFAPAIPALVDGMAILVGAAAANTTTTPTLNVNGLGAKTIVKSNALALAPGDITGSNHQMFLTYNSANATWILQNPEISKNTSSAKAWIRFNGIVTIAINASYNVASIARNAVGDYTITFTTAFSSGNYAVVTGGNSGDDANRFQGLISTYSAGTQLAGSCRVVSGYSSTGGALDFPVVCVAFYGAQP